MSTTSEETEITLYARIDDPESLQEAELIEDHIQFESTLVSGARQRVRKITPVKGSSSTADRYEVTLKVKRPNDGGVASSNETTQETDRGFYLAFADVAARGIVKRRYKFIGKPPIISGIDKDIVLPAVVYEIDQFTIPGTGEKSNWIKIDIEIDGILKALKEQGIDASSVRQKFDISNLPFTGHDMFSAASADPEQKAILDKLWEEEFAKKIAPDVFVKPKEETNALPAVTETSTHLGEETPDPNSEEPSGERTDPQE